MRQALRKSLGFMSTSERSGFSLLLFFRAIAVLFDMFGILAIGFLATSIAIFLTQGSDPNRLITIAGISIPAVNAQNLPGVSIGILGLFILKAVLSIALTYRLAKLLARVEARAARTIATKAFEGGLEGSSKHSREEVVFAIQAGSPSAFNGLLNSIGTLVAEGFLFILVLASFAFISPVAALAALIYFGIIGIIIQFFIGRSMEQAARKVAASTIEANSAISDIGDSLRESTIMGKLDFFYSKIHGARIKAADSTATQYVLSGVPRYVVETALIVGISAFVLIQAMSGDIAASAAIIGVFLTGGLRLTASLLPLQSALLTIKQSIPSSRMALEIISEPIRKSIGKSVGSTPLFLEAPNVRIKNLSFAYRGGAQPTIRGISLDIRGGDQVAFIGTSGAGKSTLVDLLLGLLDPQHGTIEIDGLSPKQLIVSQPGVFGYVPQRPGMVAGSIGENIALGIGKDEIDLLKLEKAIADAHLEEFVASLPEGINTDLGKRKDELSGGQIQRIGLARALYTQPKLLVMDEATSALDANSESEINRALEAMRGKVTVILIAHRLNTVQHSDLVFLLDEGILVAKGKFSDLLRTNASVRKLADLMAVNQ
jgi:ABC-type bacteriocin/lantibiotic exporter with double-glycine peptidase domain